MSCDAERAPNLHSVYSQPLAREVGVEPFVVRDFSVRRGHEGPQVVVLWRAPEAADQVLELRVLRRLHNFTSGPEDGKLLYAGPAVDGRLTDLDLPDGRCLYYAALSLRRDTGEWVTLPGARAEIVAIQSGFFPGKLMALLPEVYLIADKKLEKRGAGRLALERQSDPATGEAFNLQEDGITKRGQLSRFLKILGIELDLVKGLIDRLSGELDVDETSSRYLPFVASLVGLELNRELSIPKQREEVKGEVAVYKLKGTVAGIAAKARMITGFPVEVQEWCENLLISNRLDRTSADFRPAVTERFGLPRDPTSYVVDGSPRGDYACGRFGVYVAIPRGEGVPRSVVEKLARVLPSYTPVCANAKPIFLDSRYLEAYERGRLGDRYRSEVLERPKVETIYDLCWLMANDPHRLSNSRYKSAAPGVACCERWYDHIEVQDLAIEDAREFRWLFANDRSRRTNSHFRTAARLNGALDAWADAVDPRAEPAPDAVLGWLFANDATRTTTARYVTAGRSLP